MSDGPYTVYFVDALEIPHRIKSFDTLREAETKAARVYKSHASATSEGSYVHITDGNGETVSSQEII